MKLLGARTVDENLRARDGKIVLLSGKGCKRKARGSGSAQRLQREGAVLGVRPPVTCPLGTRNGVIKSCWGPRVAHLLAVGNNVSNVQRINAKRTVAWGPDGAHWIQDVRSDAACPPRPQTANLRVRVLRLPVESDRGTP